MNCLFYNSSPARIGFETLLRRFRVGSLAGRSKFPYVRLRRDRPTLKICDFQDMGSHLPLGDRQACLPGVERANIRPSEIPVQMADGFGVRLLFLDITNTI